MRATDGHRDIRKVHVKGLYFYHAIGYFQPVPGVFQTNIIPEFFDVEGARYFLQRGIRLQDTLDGFQIPFGIQGMEFGHHVFTKGAFQRQAGGE